MSAATTYRNEKHQEDPLSSAGVCPQCAGRLLRVRTGGCDDQGKSIQRSVRRHT